MAMRWIAHDTGSNELQVLQNLAHAKNYDDYIKGIQGFHSPAQNIVFASREGDVAIKVQGKLPLKTKEQGRFVQDGSNSANAWHGFIPTTQNPQVKNPERGFVSSANQHSTAPDYPYYYNGNFEDYRGRILNRKLDSLQNIKIEDMMNLQSSTYSLKAEEALPIMLQNLDRQQLDDSQKEFAEILEKWNYNYDAEQTAPILFNKWFNQLYFNTWDEIRVADETADVLYPETWRTIALMEDDPENIYFDIKSTPQKESLKDVVNSSFIEMCAEVKEWQKKGKPFEWQAYKQMTIRHLGRIPSFASRQLSVGGDGAVLNAIKGSSGPSWRMIVELGDEINAYGVYPGGQSGNPGSPFYDNMIDQWANGKYYKLLFMKEATEKDDRILYEQEFVN
jgi:penicillin G amidase